MAWCWLLIAQETFSFNQNVDINEHSSYFNTLNSNVGSLLEQYKVLNDIPNGIKSYLDQDNTLGLISHTTSSILGQG